MQLAGRAIARGRAVQRWQPGFSEMARVWGARTSCGPRPSRTYWLWLQWFHRAVGQPCWRHARRVP